MEYEAFSSDSGPPPDLTPCDNCGRKFNQNALSRHIPICAKTKTRKVFDSSKQRAEGTELAQFKKAPGGRKSRPSQAPARQQQSKPNNWRQKHTDFINTIRAARGVQHAMATGAPLPPPPPPTINPDYVQCPYCDRRFNETAADRHMPFCKEQHERLSKNRPDPTAKARQNARLGYKAPKLKKNDATSPGYGTASGGYGSSGLYGSSGHSPQSKTSPSARTGTGARGTTRSSNMTNGQSRGQSGSSGYGQAHNDYNDGSVSGGRALRTGRTAETYSEARQLSANQRSSMNQGRNPSKPTNKTPRYGGYSSSSPSSGSPYGHNDTGSKGRVGSGTARFCHECGTKYPVPQAKFCCECGVRRAMIG